MTKILQKFAIATAGAILSFVAVEANPASAAKFTFSVGLPFNHPYSLLAGSGSGFLSFDDATSGLTGIGREEASLSQLNGSFGFGYIRNSVGNFFLPGFYSWGTSDLLSVPTFTFESGDLIGMNLTFAPKSKTFAIPRPGGGIGGIIEDQLFVTGATLVQKGTVKSNPFDPETVHNIGQFSDRVNFTTEVPFQRPTSVPEPGTAIALSLFGLSLLLNKK